MPLLDLAAPGSLEGYLGLALLVLAGFGFASSCATLARRALGLSLWAASGAIVSIAVALLVRS